MLIRSVENYAHEVIYEGDIKGEGVAIFISENDPTTTVRWIVKVYVKTKQGTFFLGFLTTNLVSVDGAASRCVAFASCPGAVGWRVTFQSLFVLAGSNTGFDAETWLVPGLCCGGGGPYGVFHPPQPPGSGGGEGGGA